MTTSRCQFCSAAVYWVTGPTGKSIPLDAEATTGWVVDPSGATAGSPRAKPVQVRANHLDTCKSSPRLA